MNGGRSFPVHAIAKYDSLSLQKLIVILPHPSVFKINRGYFDCAHPIRCFLLQLKEINARLEKIEPKMRAFEGMTGHFPPSEIKSSSSLPVIGNKRHSPKTKTVRESSLAAGWWCLEYLISGFIQEA
jgi:hypothetical protein